MITKESAIAKVCKVIVLDDDLRNRVINEIISIEDSEELVIDPKELEEKAEELQLWTEWIFDLDKNV